MKINKEKVLAPLRLQNMKCHCCAKFIDAVFLPDLSSRLYYPKEKEDDQHVVLWEWKNTAFQHINPYYYDLIYCPECSFTDFRDEFMNPEINHSNKVKILHDAFYEEKQKKDSLLNILSKKIVPEEMNFERTVYLHLLAIIIQELLPGPEPQENPRMSRDWRKLARLYLRTAWLFREKNPEKGGKKIQQGYVFEVRGAIDSVLKSVTSIKSDIEHVIHNMEKQQNYEKDNKLFKKDVYLNYRANLQRIISLYNQLKTSSVNLKKVNDSHVLLLKNKTPIVGEKFYSFKNELMDHTNAWPDIPTSEVDCLQKAAVHFHMAADNDRYISDIEGLKLLEFAIKLLLRAQLKEDLDNLFKVFMKRSSIVRSDFMKKKSSTRSLVDIEMYDAEIKKANAIIQEISYLYKVGNKNEPKEKSE